MYQKTILESSLEADSYENKSDYELLALILEDDNNHDFCLNFCEKFLQKNSLKEISSYSYKDFKLLGVENDFFIFKIMSLCELCKRFNLFKVSKTSLSSAKDVYNYFLAKIGYEKKEHVIGVYLDCKNNILFEDIISIGTLNSSIVHPREVFKAAIKESANGIILVHNHPSGDPNPSNEDKLITKRLAEVGELLEIKLIDHVIVGLEGYYSFCENNFLN